MNPKSSCLGPCVLIILFSLIHTANGSPKVVLLQRKTNPELRVMPIFGSSSRKQPLLLPSGPYRRSIAANTGACAEAGPGYFKCHNGAECVSVYDLCDAVRDCDDGSDEENCPDEPECEELSHGRCKNGNCVYKFSDCTGRDSCGDGSRNDNCTMCRAGGFLCPNKRCVHSEERCTGVDACGDGSSDLNCTSCKRNAVHLSKTNRCIPREDLCSGFDVSGDGESDANCSACRQLAKLCDNKICVRPSLWCNGEDVCGDGSSNKNCTKCRDDAQLTDNNECLPSPHPHNRTHHGASAIPAHHHFTYGFIIGVFALISVVAVSVIALYLIYPSKFRWIHRRGETGLVM